jgi:hypothetical protein
MKHLINIIIIVLAIIPNIHAYESYKCNVDEIRGSVRFIREDDGSFKFKLYKKYVLKPIEIISVPRRERLKATKEYLLNRDDDLKQFNYFKQIAKRFEFNFEELAYLTVVNSRFDGIGFEGADVSYFEYRGNDDQLLGSFLHFFNRYTLTSSQYVCE